MRVVFAAEVARDLAEIDRFIGRESPRSAFATIRGLRQACFGLAGQSMRLPVVLRRGGLVLRRCVYGSYSIFYATDDGRVVVVRILHSARDYERLLSPGD